jgi:hypothetical protein
MSGNLARMLTPALLLVIAACTERDPRCPDLSGRGRYCLQPTTFVAPFEAQQKVDVTLNGRLEQMIVGIEVDADGMRLTGLTPFGQKLVQVSYDNRDVTSAMPPDARLNPALLVALLQLALWPTDTVRTGLSAPLTIVESYSQRRIFAGDEMVLTVSYFGTKTPYQRLRLIIPSVGIELDVETLSDGEKE